jgi:hypothetical protein
VKHRETAGRKRTPEFISWMNMLQRCTNPKRTDYERYGGRGISVCNEWRDFAAFLKDVGRKPTQQHSLDRVDNNGNYEPGNVKWASPSEQARNRRSSRNITAFGVTCTLAEWAERSGIATSAIRRRLQLGWEPFSAVSTPSGGRR